MEITITDVCAEKNTVVHRLRIKRDNIVRSCPLHTIDETTNTHTARLFRDHGNGRRGEHDDNCVNRFDFVLILKTAAIERIKHV